MRHICSYRLLLGLLAGCDAAREEITPTSAARGVTPPVEQQLHFTLVGPLREKKFYKLFPGYGRTDDFEASGVYALGNRYYAVFDNRWLLGSVLSTLPDNSPANTLTGTGSGNSNLEALTYDPAPPGRFYATIESELRNGAYYPRIREYDAALTYQTSLWTDVAFSSANSNKAFEGAAFVRRDGDLFMLGLVEGTGLIKVMNKTVVGWITVATLPVPADFSDYSDIDVRDNHVVVSSQQDARVWVGYLNPVFWRFQNRGYVYNFPSGDVNGNVGAGAYRLYANIEGVSWADDSTLVCVSDKADATQPSYQLFKEQSIHVFRVRR